MSLTLTVLPGEYAVAQLPAGSAVPDWATRGDLWCVMNAPDELSVVCPAEGVPDGVRVQRGWRSEEHTSELQSH